MFLDRLACRLAVFLTKEGTFQNLWIVIFGFSECSMKINAANAECAFHNLTLLS
jgi:hypothetical protein